MLSTQHLTKWVNSGGGRIFLLRDINLTIDRGEFVSIMGPSGSGYRCFSHFFHYTNI